jgi:dTDP-4-dehydrorhamnose reductase
MMKKIAITGLSGVIGTRMCKSLPAGFKVYDLYHTRKAKCRSVLHKQVDLADSKKVLSCLEKIQPVTIIHMASITHIDKCEEDYKNGRNGYIWKINVNSSDIISKYCKQSGANLIFLSTECVFNGQRQLYDEKAAKNPKNWYGRTKNEAENIIIKNYPHASIIRAVIAYHEDDQGTTLFGKLLKPLKNGKKFGAVTDQLITPTYTDDIIQAINLLLQNPQSGIFHISPKSKTTIYDFALKIASKFGFDRSLIVGKTLEEYFGKEGARLRLKNSCLKGRQTESILGFTPLTVDQVLDKISI